MEGWHQPGPVEQQKQHGSRAQRYQPGLVAPCPMTLGYGSQQMTAGFLKKGAGAGAPAGHQGATAAEQVVQRRRHLLLLHRLLEHLHKAIITLGQKRRGES